MMPGALSQDIFSVLAAVCVIACLIAIARGSDVAWLLWLGLVGMVSFTIGSFYSEYESVKSKQEPTGYVVEALIHSDFAKRGLGSAQSLYLWRRE